MAYQPYLIAPYSEGLDKSQEPWILPENAFSVLDNCFLHNGYVKRKLGYENLGRLQLQVTGAAAAGSGVGPYTATLTTPVAPGTVKIYDGVTADATDAGDGKFTASATIASGTINYLTGDVSVTYTVAGTPAGAVTFNYDYYPLSPVMGISQRETIYDNRETTVIFDRTNAYELTFTKWATTNTANQTWTGTDYNFFFGCNYYYDGSANKYFWVTNNKGYTLSGSDHRDGIKYYNGSTWATLRPLIGAATYMEGCLMLLPFKERLIALNTLEASGPVRYYQRARWCQPNAVPTGTDAWRSDLIGYGGYVDAATGENIVSAKVLCDRLIVYFEKSVWELLYTGIKEQPFTFRKISSDYGCDSTFSTIAVGDRLYSVGPASITACDGNRIEKIDRKLHTDVLDIKNTSNAKIRVHSGKDELFKLIYWTMPITETYPEKILVYNYENGSFSYFDDTFTTLGWYQSTSDYTWSSYITPDGAGDNIYKWSNLGMKWSDMITQGDANTLIGGNQQGFIEKFNVTTINGASLHIAGFTIGTNTISINSVNHNLNLNEGIDIYVKFNNVCGVTATYAGAAVDIEDLTFKVNLRTDANNFVVGFPTRTDATATHAITTFSGTYTGGGTVSKMSNFNITTKKFNPLIKDGSQLKIGYVDFYLMDTTVGKVNLDIIVDDINDEPPTTEFVKTIADFPTSRQYGPYGGTKHWNRALINSRGQFLQLKFSLSPEQMLTHTSRDVPFELHAMNLWLTKSGKMIGLA